ncbi:eukaryotic translation initiation factor 5 isoform X2 [Zootermopsis nevadensis]|uniref:eukaryotic translation initiation factor 5 isoform X2 n=1 Tax=Zootermopsis nevadensis TaxID=136037 RepID=UPI000B8E349B|nr:eukaryotic translation initiation factor 5 isoform X2 [Zootermopsis nevadensis]
MGSVNVNRSVSDAFYRYKMPRLRAKVEGKGNGIKTVIVNMIDVAKAIGRPATYPTKYFGCELGAQTQFDFKNDRFIVNGSHDATKLQDLLDGFIRKFVLCPECDNPETTLTVSQKKSTINQACKACGYHGPLEFNHKLNTFIIKNPPNLNPAAQGSSLTEGKRGKRSKKANGESNGTNGNEDGGRSSDNDSSDQVVEAPVKLADENDDDGNWAVEVSEEAVRARLQELTDGAKGMTISDDLEKTEKERMDLLYEFIKTRRDAGHLLDINVHKELVTEAERLEIKSKAPLVLAELLFDQNVHTQLKKYRILFLRFTHEDLKAQKYLLGGIEQVIALHKDTLLPKVPGIFKMFYDADILEEKVLLEWAGKVSKKYVSRELSQEIHAKAEPFIKWLKEAEEEDDSDSKDEDDDDDLELSLLLSRLNMMTVLKHRR